MNLLYIDANIYLGFYNSNRPEFKKLLGSIVELASKIFFTEQLSYEIDRNKLNIFRQSIDNYLKQVSLTATTLPEHLDEDSSPKFEDWNKVRQELEKEILASNTNLNPILNDVLRDISVSNDNVSKELSTLYKSAQKPAAGDITKAKFRKEIGNPPGKRANPLGDQLSWEQLLNIIPQVARLWIVSTDRDYFTQHKNDLYLNPILYNDLVHLNSKIEIKTFNKLSEALRDFNNKEKITSIPNKEDLDEISKSETQELIRSKKLYPFANNSYVAHSKPAFCPDCLENNTFLEGAFLNSQHGGRTFQYVCKNCGFHYDTEDWFD